MSLSLAGRRTPRRSRMSDAIPPGVSLVPAPGALHYRLQVREGGRPAQDPLHPVAGGDEARGVAGPPRLLPHGDRLTGDPAGGLNHLTVGEAGAVAQVVHAAAGVRPLQGQDVGRGQVRDVDVVTDAGAVGSRIVRAVQRHGVPLAGGDLEDDGDEVGLRTVVFTAPVAGAGGVEVAQGDVAYALLLIPGEHPLHDQLRLAIGVDRPQGRVFAYRHLVRFAVHSGA